MNSSKQIKNIIGYFMYELNINKIKSTLITTNNTMFEKDTEIIVALKGKLKDWKIVLTVESQCLVCVLQSNLKKYGIEKENSWVSVVPTELIMADAKSETLQKFINLLKDVRKHSNLYTYLDLTHDNTRVSFWKVRKYIKEIKREKIKHIRGKN